MAVPEEREVLRQAAEAAAGLLPKLGREREALDARIAAMHKVVEAYELTIGRRSRRAPDPGPQLGVDGKPKERQPRARRGRVAARVGDVLRDGEPREIPAILQLIKERFQEDYAPTSVRSVLNRKKDIYTVEAGRWRATAGGGRSA